MQSDEHANEDVERMILGNKADMEDKRVVSSSFLDQVGFDFDSQVSKERGEGIAREHNISFLETSAKVIPKMVFAKILVYDLMFYCRCVSLAFLQYYLDCRQT